MKHFIYWIFLFIKYSLQFQQVNIGGIFFDTEYDIQKSFESAINRVNSDNYITFKLLPLIRHVSVSDGSIGLQRVACDLIENGVVAIFGPCSKVESDIISVICNSTGIPHIQFNVPGEELQEEKINHQMTVNMYPSQVALSKAYSDIVQNFGWKKFTIVYDADDAQAVTRLQDLFQLRDVHNDVMKVRKFHKGDDYRILWKSIKGERRIVLDCDADVLVEFLNASIEFDLTSQFNHIFLTNLETDQANFNVLRKIVTFSANVTGARLQLNSIYGDSYVFEKPRSLLSDLIWDSLKVFSLIMQNLTNTYEMTMPPLSCEFREYEYVQKWSMGSYINGLMKSASIVNGSEFRTRKLQFDNDGQRINFKIEIYEPLDNYSLAIWDPKGQIIPVHVDRSATKKIVYRVATRIGEPYFMINPEAALQNITGNSLYHGYAVDLIEALAKELEFEYIFVPVMDNRYGSYNKETKQWDGIIGELINNDAHMGICDLTITQARRTVVDFTVPFMQLGIGILGYNKPQEPKNVLAYLDPFAGKVWIYVMIAIFIISFMFIFVARYSKREWENPHPCNKDPDTLENMWNLGNCLYLTVASIMTAGCDILPKSAAMRTFTAMWWIFAIIIANSYTANLAAFLTNSKREGSITNIKDLAEQTKVKFGTMEGGSTKTFFSESNETVYRLAYNIMNNDDPSAYTKDNSEGVERVLKNRGTYMFLMETTGIEYNRERNCELRMVGEKFGEKHYAIAVPFGANYRSNLSVGILKLSERGELFQFKMKWWKNTNVTCNEVEDSGDTPDMTFEEVRGIFYTLFIGVFIAFLVGITEFLMYTQKVAAEEKVSLQIAFLKEIKFVLSIWNNRKPIHCTPSTSERTSLNRCSEKSPQSIIENKHSSKIKELHELQLVKTHNNIDKHGNSKYEPNP